MIFITKFSDIKCTVIFQTKFENSPLLISKLEDSYKRLCDLERIQNIQKLRKKVSK